MKPRNEDQVRLGETLVDLSFADKASAGSLLGGSQGFHHYRGHMSHSLNSLKGGYIGDYIGDYYRGH